LFSIKCPPPKKKKTLVHAFFQSYSPNSAAHTRYEVGFVKDMANG
jgi:hypothetical protein